MAGISCGVIGLPNVGKSTLFNALTRVGAKVENYPFCTIDPNVGVVNVPDVRLDELNAVEKKPNQIPAVIEFVDIAGLVEGASRGEGRGNQFLENIHHADMLVHVVRCFDDPNVAHVRADLDALDDVRIINIELILADLQTAEKALARLGKKSRGGDAAAKDACEVLEKLREHLDGEAPARTAGLSAEELKAIREIRFLTHKPVMYVPNVGEDALPDFDTPEVRQVRELAAGEGNVVLPVCAKIEAEIAELDSEEADEFIQEMGLGESGLDRLIRECHRRLGLITFLTVGDHEVRAWTIPEGTSAPRAGAVIHTDFETNFIRAEVIAFEDFSRCGSRQAVKESGLMRIEGKDYVVRDGDLLFFRIGP